MCNLGVPKFGRGATNLLQPRGATTIGGAMEGGHNCIGKAVLLLLVRADLPRGRVVADGARASSLAAAGHRAT